LDVADEADEGRERQARARAGRGAWRDLAGGRDLVAELLAERRAEAAMADLAHKDPDALDRLLAQFRR
jgi:hypothetical protein